MDPESEEGVVDRDLRWVIGAIALGLFWVTAVIGGFCFGIGQGFLAMSGASLVLSYLLGSTE